MSYKTGSSEGVSIFLSLPEGMTPLFNAEPKSPAGANCKALNRSALPLNSIGEIADLLQRAAAAEGFAPAAWEEWLQSGWKVLLLSRDGGVDFPPEMPTGRILLPVPVFRWSLGQRLDQTWLDLQLPLLLRLLQKSPSRSGLLLCYAENLLRVQSIPKNIPAADVVHFGVWAPPEELAGKGALLCNRNAPASLAAYLARPTASQLRDLGLDYAFLGDTGIQLLSAEAVKLLLSQSEQPPESSFPALFLQSLGRNPTCPKPDLSDRLTSSVCILEDGRLHPLHNGRDLIQSTSSLMNLELNETKLGMMGAKRHPNQYLQNSRFSFPLRLDANHTLWVENSVIPASWKLASEHVLTGIPENEWELQLEPQVCLDFSPENNDNWCIKFYRINDRLAAPLDKAEWCANPVETWLRKRGLTAKELFPDCKIPFADAKLFPVLSYKEISAPFIQWLTQEDPEPSEEFTRLWLSTTRRSLHDSVAQMDYIRWERQRSTLRDEGLQAMLRNCRWSVFYKADLQSTAELFGQSKLQLPGITVETDKGYEPLQVVHDRMFRSAVMRYRKEPDWEHLEAEAFRTLCRMIVEDAQIEKVEPRRSIIEDQVVWGRCPVRLDLAGGWSDTPPYCLERGGRVVNLAVDLNGQPPIQVFAKLSDRPELVVRSIDQGVENRFTSYEELRTYAQPGDSFALAKAALAQVGFLPEFSSLAPYPGLKEQLQDFGGGIELSLLSAVPKGSGLGTSSILAATVLATLAEVCGLAWDRNALFTRTLALEQMLTTGGGWQDQAGGIFRGIKMIETASGLKQSPVLRWLPDQLFEQDYANSLILLYYTGITRIAKNILHEIVRGIFLNSPRHLGVIEDIAENARNAFNAIQMASYSSLVESVRESWRLNQLLDSGTNPPEVQGILDKVKDYLDAAKLLGAGGGGYLLMFAKDREAAERIRSILTENPPNNRARFVHFALSDQGLQLTRS
jgi:galactokinase/mevalonate kinase-like predicted kinase